MGLIFAGPVRGPNGAFSMGVRRLMMGSEQNIILKQRHRVQLYHFCSGEWLIMLFCYSLLAR